MFIKKFLGVFFFNEYVLVGMFEGRTGGSGKTKS